MTRLTPFCSFSCSTRLFAPPMMSPTVCECPLSSSVATLRIWIASSRVGVITSATVPLRGLIESLCISSTAGMRNASVLPDPVRAAPSTSCPSRSSGIVRHCTSIMNSKPMA
eukprot:Amastigsp_a1050_42.p6 type:complete len:112 gc:universal Amastigsp_a1050_42:1223-1558(+)